MRKVLLITYYWPPSGGVGVQRWLKLSKYLPDYGWEPVILTPENPDFSLKDPSLAQHVLPQLEVLRLPIWEPYKLLHYLKGGKDKPEGINAGMVMESGKNNISGQFLRWVRGNFFVPDPRVFWVKPAVQYALSILEANQIEAIISTGPPHSMHLIGQKLKKKTGLPWLADFRDPWSQWEVLKRMHPSPPVVQMHKKLERTVVRQADKVLAASPAMSRQFNQLAKIQKVSPFVNGIDPEDAEQLGGEPAAQDKFRLVYTGLLNEKREPRMLWHVLEEMCRTMPGFSDKFEMLLVGNISAPVVENLSHYPEVNRRTKIMPYQKHAQVFRLLKQAGVLLMLIDNDPAAGVIIPAKLFEYLAARRPVIYIGDPENDAGQLLEKEGAGKGYAFEDRSGIQACITSLFREYQAKGALYRPSNYEPYLRNKQAAEMAKILSDIAG